MALGAALFTSSASALDTTKPSQYFNDYAHVLSPERDKQLNDQLADYERKTTNQLVVVVEPDKTLDQPIEQIGIDLARQWGIGQHGGDIGTVNRNNGVLFLVFPAAHKMRLEVGRGLEGSLPDTAANEILRNIVAPQFKGNNFDAGLTQGIAAVESRANTEGNKGVNRTVDEQKRDQQARQANNNNGRNTATTTTTESSDGIGFGTMILFLLFLAAVAYIAYRVFFKSNTDSSNTSSSTNNSNINDSFDSYHNGGYTPPAPAPRPTPAPYVPSPRYQRTYSNPTPTPPRSHSGLGTFAAGAAAGAIADEVLRPRTEEKKKASNSDDSDYSGSTASWTPSTPDPTPSYSAPDPSPSSDSGSSWTDTSSSSDFGGGGGDFGGGGSSSDW